MYTYVQYVHIRTIYIFKCAYTHAHKLYMYICTHIHSHLLICKGRSRKGAKRSWPPPIHGILMLHHLFKHMRAHTCTQNYTAPNVHCVCDTHTNACTCIHTCTCIHSYTHNHKLTHTHRHAWTVQHSLTRIHNNQSWAKCQNKHHSAQYAMWSCHKKYGTFSTKIKIIWFCGLK